MVNSFNSSSTMWATIALSDGMCETLAGCENLTEGEQLTMTYLKTFGVANSYWKSWMTESFLQLMRKILVRTIR